MSAIASWGVLLAPQAAMAEKALAQTSGWLGDSEQQRLTGLHSKARQSLFLGCRYALRLLLAEDEMQVRAWILGSAAEHSPWVEQYAISRYAPLPLLSLSHSGAWLACAKAPVPIGVDLEIHSQHKKRNVRELAELVCAPEEQFWLAAQPAEKLQQCFVQLWCLKEAYFKSLGTGVDLEKVCRWAWHIEMTEPVPISGRRPVPVPVSVPVAYARLWQATTETNDSLYLAMCALQPLPELMPWQADVGLAVEWRSVSNWVLHASNGEVSPNGYQG